MPKNTAANFKKPENARAEEKMLQIAMKRFAPLTPMNVNHVGRKSKIWVDPRSRL